MKIACLQFAPQLGKVDENIARVDALLEAADMSNLDLLVLPELAFSGMPTFLSSIVHMSFEINALMTENYKKATISLLSSPLRLTSNLPPPVRRLNGPNVQRNVSIASSA